MNQYAFYFDANKCIYCRSCVVACKDKNDLRPGRKFRRIHTCSTGGWAVDADGVSTPQDVFSYSVSVACNHCETPACKNACPANAIDKRKDGIVFIDRDLCTGCGSCASVCPYNAPSLDKGREKMEKCDFCRDLLAVGEIPVCVSACSMQALEFGDMDTLRVLHRDAVQQVKPLAEPTQTNPSLLITAHRFYRADMDVRQYNMPEELQANEE